MPSNGLIDVINVSAYRHPPWGTGSRTPEELVEDIADSLSISPDAIIGVGETGSSVGKENHYIEFFKAVVESPVHIGIIIVFIEDYTTFDPGDDAGNWLIPPSDELKEILAHPQYLEPIIYH
jgi:hypothetical protein